MSKPKPLINFVLDFKDDMVFEKPLWNMSDEEVDKLDVIEMAIFRGGRFEHPYYGELNFTREYLEQLIKNFQDGVCSNAISFNEDHSRNSTRSYGWLEGKDALFIKDIEFDTPMGPQSRPFLMARYQPNKNGKEAIKGKEFRYFSAEISDDYTNREIVKVKLANGKEVEQVAKYGPTLVGVALTNHPFIPNLPGMFSSTPLNCDMTVKPEVQTFGEDCISGKFNVMKFTTLEDSPEVEEPKKNSPTDNENLSNNLSFDNSNEVPAQESNINLSDNKGDFGMTFLELLNKYNAAGGADVKLSLLSQTKTSEFSDVEKGILIALESQAKSEKAKDEALKLELSEIRSQRDELAKEMKRARVEAYAQNVKAFCAELTVQNHHTSVINEVRDILLSLDDDSRDMRFSRVDATTKAKTELDVVGIVGAILAKLPKDARLDQQTHLSSDEPKNKDAEVPAPAPTPAPAQQTEIPAKVKLYAANLGMTPEQVEVKMYDAITEDGDIDFKILKKLAN